MRTARSLLAAPSIVAAIAALALVAPALVFADGEADLDHAIAKKDSGGAKTALGALGSDAKAASAILKDGLKLKDLDCHQELVQAIASVKDDAGVKKLADACRHDPSPEMRYVLVEGLALGATEEGGKAVLDALDDKTDIVATIAARNARRVDPQVAMDRLITRLEKAERNPKEASLAREVTGSLSVITGESLTFALEWKGWWLQHKDGFKGAKPPEPAAGNAAGNDDGKKGHAKGSDAGADEGGSSGGDTVTRRLARERPADAHTVERMADDDVICVKGGSDSVEDVLKAIGIKHKVVKKDAFKDVKLDPKSVLVINCDGKGHPLFDDEEIARIREFVEKGGYLFSSDWELKNTIERAFPGSIAFAGKSSNTYPGPGFKCDIMPSREASGHPFLRDVFPMTTWDAGKLTWQMDEMSFLIKVLSPDVKVLIESQELKKKFPETPAVAVTFAWTSGGVAKPRKATATGPGSENAAKQRAPGGCVLHVLSHFKHQKDANAGDHFALQQLLLNFFLEKQAAKHGG